MEKKVIDQIRKCYSVNALNIQGKTSLVFAGEGDGSLTIYQGENFAHKRVIWDESAKRGGTMTICTVTDKEGYFFVSTGFFTMTESGSSAIFLVRYHDGNFIPVKVCDIPYLHRFDVITVESHRYLIACTLHSGKADMADWSKPGKILVAELPFDLDDNVTVIPKILKEGLTMNHGFNRVCEYGVEKVLIAAKEGIFKIAPPYRQCKNWKIEHVFGFPASDICALDIDGDGELEYGVLSPFHGDTFSVYKKQDGEAVKIYEHEKHLDFYHAIYAGEYQQQPSFIIGARKKDMDLFRVYYNKETKEIETELIEMGAGSSNVRIIHTSQGDIIMSANRQKDEAAIYFD